MIAAVAFAVAACAHAAAFSWSTSMSGKIYEPETETLLASGTAYLFEVMTVTQSSLVSEFAAGTLDLSSKSSLSSKAISSGGIASTSFSDGTAVGDYLNSYFAAVVTISGDDYLFISDAASTLAVEGKTSKISFNAKTASQAAAFDAAGGYSAGGWYTTAAVPEPTSGLLMLLGMAGLALRRRRA